MVSPRVDVGRTAWPVASRRTQTATGFWITIVVLAGMTVTRCGDVNAALEHVTEAQRISADLLVQFTSSADAANRAVMADTDEASVVFAREADQATQAVQKDVDTLGPILQGLGYTDETQLLQQFVSRFADYRTLDRRILDLAVENTNLKAQRLSFGPAADAANSFRDALQTVAPSNPADAWQVKALVATAVATVREIEVLEAPHIADADDAVMTRMEQRMATSESAARSATAALAMLVAPGSRRQLTVASGALDQFIALNTQVISLSRRNTNVRSLALSLNEKRPLTTACTDSLHTLRDALAKRGYTVGRWK